MYKSTIPKERDIFRLMKESKKVAGMTGKRWTSHLTSFTYCCTYSGVRMKRQCHKINFRRKIFKCSCRLGDIVKSERIILKCIRKKCVVKINRLKPSGHLMHQQFNIQQLYVLPALFLCVRYLFENKERLVSLTA